MKKQNRILKYTEIVLVTFVFLVLFITPIFFREDNNIPIQIIMFNQLEILIPLILLFILNRFILVPKLLFKGKQKFFIISVLGIIFLVTIGSYIYNKNSGILPHPNMPPAENQMRVHPRSNIDRAEPFRNPQMHQPNQPRPIPPYANILLFSILIVGFDTGLMSGLRWIETENIKVRLEKENLDNKLVLLRNQVSPHFFMNTLNNIHSLVDINTEEAKEALIKLSKMMRYLLYETETEKTTLKREIEFLESYINLMRLRFSEKVNIILNIPTSIPEKTLPPFLFISLIENAFKHGISYKRDSFINIDLAFNEKRLLLVVKNSTNEKDKSTEFSGIGIENTRKRLDLIYGNNYHLDIIDSEKLFTINLSIPL